LQPIDEMLAVTVTVFPGSDGLGAAETLIETGPPPDFGTASVGLVMLKPPPVRDPVKTANSEKVPDMSSSASTV
jgi:hypothetical protein